MAPWHIPPCIEGDASCFNLLFCHTATDILRSDLVLVNLQFVTHVCDDVNARDNSPPMSCVTISQSVNWGKTGTINTVSREVFLIEDAIPKSFASIRCHF